MVHHFAGGSKPRPGRATQSAHAAFTPVFDGLCPAMTLRRSILLAAAAGGDGFGHPFARGAVELVARRGLERVLVGVHHREPLVVLLPEVDRAEGDRHRSEDDTSA